MTRLTKREEFASLVRKMGGSGSGTTTADVLKELNRVHGSGGGGDFDTGELSDEDMDDVFEDGE